MTREELLCQLHSIKVGVSLVALPSEGALECTCITPKGYSYEWFNLYDWTWPAYSIMLPPTGKWSEICLKLKQGTLQMQDISGTELEDFYTETVAEEDRTADQLNAFFVEAANVSAVGDVEIFALVWDKTVQFFLNEEYLQKAFSERWAVTPWEDYPTDKLESMLYDIEDGFDAFPLTCFREDA